MAVKVSVGDVYTDPKIGASAKGKYGFVTAKAEKGSDKIALFFANPDDIDENTYAVEVLEIVDVSMTAKNVNGNWYKNVNCTAKVRAVEGGSSPIELDDEGDVPF